MVPRKRWSFSSMAAEQWKAPNTKIEPPKPSPLGVSAPNAPVGPGQTLVDRPAGLDVRAQSARLKEAVEAPDPLDLDAAVAAPSPQRGSFFARYGSRAIKSALGLGVVVIAGVGPVQRLLEFSSVEAVVNARLAAGADRRQDRESFSIYRCGNAKRQTLVAHFQQPGRSNKAG